MLSLDAINRNLNFPQPRLDEFENAMIKALKSTKERFRRQQKREIENDESIEELVLEQSFLNSDASDNQVQEDNMSDENENG